MKILYTGAFRFPTGDAAAARVLNIARLLRELGHEVEFLSFGRDRNNALVGTYDSFEYHVTEDLDQNAFFARLRGTFQRGYKAYRVIRKNIKSYDCVIVYNPALFFTIKILRICKCSNVKLVLDATEWYSCNDFIGRYLNITYWLNEINMSHVSTRINNIISITSFLDGRYARSSNRIILPPLVDLQENKWNKSENVPLTSFPGVTLIYAGNSANSKDRIDVVLEALTRLVDEGFRIRILLLGNCNQELLTRYVDYKNDILFLGKIPQKDVPSYYSVADFSILIRDNTRKSKAGFSTKLVESIASGVPPIINYTSDESRYLSENACIKLKDGGVESIIEALKQVCEMPKESRCVMRKYVKEVAARHFDYRAYVNQVRKFVENIR